MSTRIIILGDGTGGLICANLLTRKARKRGLDLDIKLVGRSAKHTYQPGLLFLPFQKPGYRRLEDIQRNTRDFVGRRVTYLCEEIVQLDKEKRVVVTANGQYGYDWLVLSLGCRTAPEEIPGLAENWGRKVHGFYTPDSAIGLSGALERFQGGDLVIDVAEMPIKCPVAPIEFACLADHYLHQRGIRNRSRITLVTPLAGAFTKPVCNDRLIDVLRQKDIYVIPNSSLAQVEEDHFSCPEGKDVPFDLLVTIPPHEGSDLIEDAGLGDGLGFGLTDKFTLKSMVAERIFLLGDNTNVPTSKAGSVAHFQADVVVHNLLREIAGEAAEPIADGHANCFIETGFGKSILIDFNYDTQPVPGAFPMPVVGPMSLLKETRTNHLGKLAFKRIYWDVLLRGLSIPLVGSQMSKAGKQMHILKEY